MSTRLHLWGNATMLSSETQSRLIGHLSLSASLPVIRFSYGFALAAILSKYLSVEAYGSWSLFISLVGLILTFSSLNLMYASNVLLTGKDRNSQKREIFSVGVTKFTMTILVYIGFAIYLSCREVIDPSLILLLFLALVFRTANDLFFGLCRSLLLLHRQVLFLLVESCLILLALVISCYVLDGGLYGALYGFILAELLAASLGLFLLKDYLTFATYDFAIVKKYLAIGLPLIPFAFSDLIVNALVPLLIKLYDGFEAVAFYSIAQKVALVATIPTAIVDNVYAQHLRKSRLSKEGPGVRKTFLMFIAIYLAMALPLLLILYLLGEDVIRLISTDEYVRSYGLMLLLVIVNMMVSVGSMLTTVFAVYERTRTAGYIWLGVLAVFLGISGYCYDRWEMPGIAYALIFSFGLGLLLIALAVVQLQRSVRRERDIER